MDQTTRRYDGGGWGERGGETWLVELLVAVAGVFFFLLRGFSAPATNPWLGCWFRVEELVSRAAGRSSRGLLLPPARLLRPGDQSVVGVLVSCRGAESMHIKHHGSIFI